MQKIFIILLFFSLHTFPQENNLSAGGHFGGGSISKNTPGETVFTSGIFVQGLHGLIKGLDLRAGFFFSADLNKLLPDSRKQHTPSLWGFSLKAIYAQPIEKDFFWEAGLGPIIIRDNIFFNEYSTGYGFTISLAAGLDFKKDSAPGFRLSAGGENFLTFSNINLSSLTFYLQGQYFF